MANKEQVNRDMTLIVSEQDGAIILAMTDAEEATSLAVLTVEQALDIAGAIVRKVRQTVDEDAVRQWLADIKKS